MHAEPIPASTRGLALAYPTAMRSPLFVLPLLLTLTSPLACKEEEATGAEFGEPCGGDAGISCSVGLECYIGYCEEQCDSDIDCRTIDGFQHKCDAGLCHIYCDEAPYMCPQTLATPLECVTTWCESAL